MHIKLTVRRLSLCVVAGVSASERKRNKKRNGGKEEEEGEEEESRSREVLCLWKRGKRGDKGHRCRIRPWGSRQD